MCVRERFHCSITVKQWSETTTLVKMRERKRETLISRINSAYFDY